MAESASSSSAGKAQKKKRSSSYVNPVKKTIASWNPINSLPSVHKMRSAAKTSPEPERQSNHAADELLANFKKSFLKEPGVVLGGLSESKPFLRGSSMLKITEWILFQADETSLILFTYSRSHSRTRPITICFRRIDSNRQCGCENLVLDLSTVYDSDGTFQHSH